MIAALFALVLQLLAHAGPAPAPYGHGATAAPAPVVVAPTAPRVPQYSQGPHAEGSAPATVPSCLAGEEWDGLRCVALQLPEETTGRQYDPAD